MKHTVLYYYHCYGLIEKMRALLTEWESAGHSSSSIFSLPCVKALNQVDTVLNPCGCWVNVENSDAECQDLDTLPDNKKEGGTFLEVEWSTILLK